MFDIFRLPPGMLKTLLRSTRAFGVGCNSITEIGGLALPRYPRCFSRLRLDRGCACSLFRLSRLCGFPTRVEQWGIQEVSLQSKLTHANPFTEVELRCEFSKGNQKFDVDGFYDGNQTWKIRFMPDEQGEWTYRTRSNDLQLDGRSGSFIVGPPGPHNHGPVRVNNTYHFAYADGTPYFLLGTTLYNWLNRDPELEQRTLNTLS